MTMIKLIKNYSFLQYLLSSERVKWERRVRNRYCDKSRTPKINSLSISPPLGPKNTIIHIHMFVQSRKNTNFKHGETLLLTLTRKPFFSATRIISAATPPETQLSRTQPYRSWKVCLIVVLLHNVVFLLIWDLVLDDISRFETVRFF
jgi:hypothetical protein